MLELLLLLLYVRRKLKIQKAVEEIEYLRYNPGLISEKEIEHAVQEMKKYIFHSAMLIYTQLLSLLENKTVIQLQMYGIGTIGRKEIYDNISNGTFQYAVALKLVSKFCEKYPQLTMTSQEPRHSQVEIEYLQHRNVHVFEGESFSSDYFLNALANAVDVQNPIMICYMIHLPINVFEDFLHAHWRPDILSKIIFVGNEFDGKWCADHFWKYKKIQAYFKMAVRKRLPFERAKRDPNSAWMCPVSVLQTKDFLDWMSFCSTGIYTISYENAVKIVKKVL